MNAKQIDYAYIVCLNDSADDFQIREKVVKQALIKKEFVFESFSGNIDIDESVTSLLLPVFNGKKLFFDKSEFTDKSMSVVNELPNVSALFSAKSLVLEEHSVVYVFVKSEGIWYIDKGHNVFESIQREELIDLVVRLFKG